MRCASASTSGSSSRVNRSRIAGAAAAEAVRRCEVKPPFQHAVPALAFGIC